MTHGTGIIRFGAFQLDPARGVLERAGTPVRIRPKTYALLTCLAARPDCVITKDELLAAVWPGIFVSDDTLTQTVRDLRRALGDGAGDVLRTVPGRGYLFAPPQAAAPERRVAVLPFDVAGDDGDDRLFRGLAEDIAYGIGRFRTLAVIDPHSTLHPAGDQAVAEADYHVTGRAARRGDRWLIRVALVEAATGRQIWADETDADADAILALDRTVPQKIVPRLVANAEEAVVAPGAPATGSMDAFREFVLGRRALREVGEAANRAAREHLLRALGIDPDFALAHAWLGLTEIVIHNYNVAPPEVMDTALSHAARAISLAPEEARCHRIMGLVRLFRREFDLAEDAFRTALRLNPYDADTLAQMAYLEAIRGRGETALQLADRAMELNPLHPDWYWLDRSVAAYVARRYRESADCLLRLPVRGAMRETRLAAALAMAGDLTAAARHLAAAARAEPGWQPLKEVRDFSEFENAADTDHLAEGVARAMGL